MQAHATLSECTRYALRAGASVGSRQEHEGDGHYGYICDYVRVCCSEWVLCL